MEKGNWQEIDQKLKQTIKEIFRGQEIESLTDFEKRRRVFDYICDNVEYDYELLNNIKYARKNKTKISREPYLELESVIEYKEGICNAISQYYKLLLEQIGIPCYCVICTDGTEVPHQLCLTYDKDNKTFSFDDATSVIVKRGSKDDFFDYDLDSAHNKHQGMEPLTTETYWLVLPENYIDFMIGRKTSPFNTLTSLPNNLSSTRSKPTLK